MRRWCSLLLSIVLIATFCMPIISFAETMTASEECIAFIKRREGFSKYPYWDNRQWTVGYGTRVPDGKLEEYKKNGIPEKEALELLASMLKDFEKSLHKYITKYNLELNQHQFDALVSFSFNCGAGWTTSTNGYLNTAVRTGKTGSEFLHAMFLWSRSGGDFILMKRRMMEANMYLNGVYGDHNTIPDNYRCVYLDGNGGTVSYIPHGFDANEPIKLIYNFKTKPTGIDKDGKTFTYTFLGWYTESGEKVTILDENIENGTILYAQWANEQGEPVVLPKGELISAVNVTVKDKVTVRKGPGTYYPSLGKVEKNTVLTVTEIYEYSGVTWGKTAKGWLSISYTNYDEVIKAPEVWPKHGIVNATHVNVRTGPGLNHDRVYQLNSGDEVNIHEKKAADNLDWGRLDDNNWICLTYITFDEEEPSEPETPPVEPPEENPDEILPEEPDPEPPEPPAVPGDMNKDDDVTKDDAIYLLRHVLFAEKYPLEANGDINADGTVTQDDAIYLLRHVLFPEKYPLTQNKEAT